MPNTETGTAMSHRALNLGRVLWQSLKPPAGFARASEGIVFFGFSLVLGLVSAILGFDALFASPAGRAMVATVFLAGCFVGFELMVVAYRHKQSAIERRACERLGEAIESLSDGVSLFDPQGRLILANAAQRQPRGSGDVDIVQRADGRWLQIRASRTASGNVVRIESDVTDLMQHEAALRRAKDEAETANRAKSEFLAMMSHELRTPLNAIIGFAEVMRAGTLGATPTRHQEYLKDIADSGHHLLQIISDILDMSKLEAGMAALSEGSCDVAAIIRRCERLIAHRAEHGRVTVEARLAPNLPRLWADEVKLRQIILNLLSNAVKFTGARGQVVITARDLGADAMVGGVMIEIADNGIGMAPESIPVALSPFRQLDNNIARKYEGTGLGLPLCKGLVELHGGTLDLQSAVGVGTTARVRFPAARRRLREVQSHPAPIMAVPH